jgi:hypothetical protein
MKIGVFRGLFTFVMFFNNIEHSKAFKNRKDRREKNAKGAKKKT